MEANKILSANILDLIFDDRNKEYGAYDLRVTYPERVKKSLLVVFIIAGIAVGGAAIANSFKPHNEGKLAYKEVIIQPIDPKKDEVVPPPEKPKPQPVETKTIKVTVPQIVDDKDVIEPPPTKDDIINAQVSNVTKDGNDYDGIAKPIDDGKGIVEAKKVEEDPDAIAPIVQVQASYNGDWVKFLTRNLNANTPVDNGAPAGRYNVMMQFVVDKEGNLSDIIALTNYGYGMEQEAIRVLKKAKGWKPGIQNGHEVKSYHKQPITFVVDESN